MSQLTMKDIDSNRANVSEKRKPMVCFISFGSIPIILQDNTGFVCDAESEPGITGGAELQQGLLAEELRKNGYEVSFIVPDVGQKSHEVINGIEFFKLLPSGFTVKRNISIGRRLYLYCLAPYLIWNRLNRAQSDIYFEKMVGESSALVALFARFKRRKYIYCVSADSEVDGTGIKDKNFLFAQLTKLAIRNANCIVVQSEYQQKLLKGNFNKNGILIKNMCFSPDNISEKEEPPIVAWAARIEKPKQPELFLELARAMPDVRFRMIGGPASLPEQQQHFKDIEESAARVSNIELTGFVPYHQVNQYFDSASIFINTSSVEGFPNTFLQAWSRQVPVVSLNIDPDEIICRYSLGFHSKTFKQMVRDVRLLIDDEPLRRRMGENGRRYVEREHDVKKIAKQYMDLFERLLRGKDDK